MDSETPQLPSESRADRFDPAWKRLLDCFFADVLQFLAPDLHALVDWSVAPAFLDKELDGLRPEAAEGRRTADKLAKVRRRDGVDLFVLVLVEVQAQHDPTFAARTFALVRRAIDRYDLPVAPVVILADRSRRWRPSHYEYRFGQSGLRLDFTTVKLVDFEPQLETLEASPLPIARIVAAHLRTLRERAPGARETFTQRAIRGLLALGLPAGDIRDWLAVIDELMVLPAPWNQRLWAKIAASEDVPMDTYILPLERNGWERGKTEGRAEGRVEEARHALRTVLLARFTAVPEPLQQAIEAIADITKLESSLRAAATSPSLEAFAAEFESRAR